MKILVDKLPETPEECPFSERCRSLGWVDTWRCSLMLYIPSQGRRAHFLCQDTSDCHLLVPFQGTGREENDDSI